MALNLQTLRQRCICVVSDWQSTEVSSFIMGTSNIIFTLTYIYYCPWHPNNNTFM